MSEGHKISSDRWTSRSQIQAHRYLWPAIERLLPEGVKKIIDIGCGKGFLASCLAEKGFEVTGIDVSLDEIAMAKKAYPNVFFCVASAYDNLAERFGNDFDLVLSAEVIEHLYHPKLLLQNAHAVLRIGGAVVVTTPYHGYLKNLALSVFNKWDDHHTVNLDGGHIKFFSEETLTTMLREVGFQNMTFSNAGRFRWFWKSIVCRADKRFAHMDCGQPI